MSKHGVRHDHVACVASGRRRALIFDGFRLAYDKKRPFNARLTRTMR